MVKSLLITIWGAQTLETVPENVPEHCVQTTEIKLQNDVRILIYALRTQIIILKREKYPSGPILLLILLFWPM